MHDEPVHKPKGVVFGPTIVYDAERCVMCTRCIRFMDEVAKDPVLDMRERGNLNEVAVSPGRQLDGHYTFMTEHVCPVGALTTIDFRFKARVWFLRTAPSGVPGLRDGLQRAPRLRPPLQQGPPVPPAREQAVNKYWMCDEGMLTYKEAHDGRVLEASVESATRTTAQALEEAKALLAGVPMSAVAIVLSARYSLEDNWALRELGLVLMGTKNVYVSGRPDGYEDDILIHHDKNSNTRGVAELAPGAKSFQQLVDDVAARRITHVIALGGSAPVDAGGLRAAKLVTIAAHAGPLTELASVVLPATSWAEHSGTYVNAKGMRQIADKALEPLGASQPAWKQLADLATALGYEPSWVKLKHIRGQLIGSAAPDASTPSLPTSASAE